MEQLEERVYVVDDDESVLTALSRSLTNRGFSVYCFKSASEFLHSYQPKQADCLLLDVVMPGMSGFELHELLLQQYPTLPVIFLTGHGDIPMCVEAIKKGAFDFLEKPYSVDSLHKYIDLALAHSKVLYQQQVEASEINQRIKRLSKRELQVMTLLVSGIANKTNKDIAMELGISHRTVDDHRARIMHKMEARSFTELVEIAKVCGIV